MSQLSVKQQTTDVKSECPLLPSTADTYANAILRTLASLKPPSPPITKYRRSHVVNEVSGLKTCIHRYTLHFLTLIFKWKLMGEVPPFFFSSLLVSYVTHIGRNDFFLSAFSEIEYLRMWCDDKLILYNIQRLSLSRNSDQLYVYIYMNVYGTNYRMKNYKIDLRTECTFKFDS